MYFLSSQFGNKHHHNERFPHLHSRQRWTYWWVGPFLYKKELGTPVTILSAFHMLDNFISWSKKYGLGEKYTHRVHTEWQFPISGVNSIMMKKSALAGEGGGCTPTPFHSSYHHVQSCSVRYAPAERSDTLTLFHLYPYVYSVNIHNGIFSQFFSVLIFLEMYGSRNPVTLVFMTSCYYLI